MNSSGQFVVVITGKMARRRRDYVSDLSNINIVAVDRVDLSTDLVFAASCSSSNQSTKYKAALRAKIPIVGERVLDQLIAGTITIAEAIKHHGGVARPAPQPKGSKKARVKQSNDIISASVKGMGKRAYIASF